MSIKLNGLEPFARGGNRLCFVHPEDSSKVIKVRRPDFTLEDLRRKQRGLKRFRPLFFFDENYEEFSILTKLEKGQEVAFQYISRSYGYVETDLGKGLSLELIRDFDGNISQNLEYVVLSEGVSKSLQRAIDDFSDSWLGLGLPSRDLSIFNLVVQKRSKGEVGRLVVIDGLGNPSPVPTFFLPKSYFVKKAGRKLKRLHQNIEALQSKFKLNLDL